MPGDMKDYIYEEELNPPLPQDELLWAKQLTPQAR